MSTTLSVSHITKQFIRDNKTFTAVDDLSFTASQGEVIGFLGPNGAGKTTSIRMMCGLVQPTSGNIIINGHDITTAHDQAMLSLGAVLEGTRNIYWHMSAYQNLLYFGRLKQLWGRKLKQRALELLKEFNLYDVRNERVGTFSRGMQQKVAIGCALIHNPHVILLDEPTLGLDHTSSEILKQWILKLAHEDKKTIILTTHQLDIVEELCDRIIVINKGKILADTSLENLKKLIENNHETKYKIVLDKPHVSLSGGIQPTLAVTEGHRTTLEFAIPEEKDLCMLLSQISHTNIPLVSLERVEPSLEEVFVQLTKNN